MNFDDAAQAWDTPVRQARAKVLAAQICESWKGKPESVLDFGCGSGLIAFELRAHAGLVYGYDASEEMGRVFQEKREALQADNVRLLSGEEMRALSYDVIISSMVLHHILDVEAEIAGLKRLLKPGGRLNWIDLDAEDGSFHADDPDFKGHNGFDRDEVRRILTGCGLRDIAVQTAFEGEKNVNGGPVPYSLFMAVAG
jgi:ubiquinone/menaquinone biosynthesis C-methylase UbiE